MLALHDWFVLSLQACLYYRCKADVFTLADWLVLTLHRVDISKWVCVCVANVGRASRHKAGLCFMLQGWLVFYVTRLACVSCCKAGLCFVLQGWLVFYVTRLAGVKS